MKVISSPASKLNYCSAVSQPGLQLCLKAGHALQGLPAASSKPWQAPHAGHTLV